MASELQTFRKDPDAVLDYGFDWSSWLEDADTISDSAWSVPSGITKGDDETGETMTKIWLSGGEAGETYTISNKITTSAGRTDERSFDVVVEER